MNGTLTETASDEARRIERALDDARSERRRLEDDLSTVEGEIEELEHELDEIRERGRICGSTGDRLEHIVTLKEWADDPVMVLTDRRDIDAAIRALAADLAKSDTQTAADVRRAARAVWAEDPIDDVMEWIDAARWSWSMDRRDAPRKAA